MGAVRKTVKKIQEKYTEKGFYLAEVTSRIEDRPDNQVVVVFVVNERAKVQVRRIHFVGNDSVSKEEILPYMQTQEGSYLAFLSSAGTYKEDAFQRDLQAIQAVYLEKGYVNVKVGKPTIALTPDRTMLFISIPVEEGEQYTIGKLDFSGELLGMRPFLPQLLQSAEGELFVRSKVGHDLFAMADFYKDMGYAYVNVNPVTKLDPKARTLGLTFDVQPGRKVLFERIEIQGNAKTRDKVIRRELRIYEGDLYSASGHQDLQAARHRARLLRDRRDLHQEGERRRPHRRGGRGEGEGHRHLPGRRRLLLLRELHPHRPDQPEQLLRLGPDPLASRSSGRRSGSSARSSSWSRTSSTPSGPSPSTSTPTRTSTPTSPAARWAGRSPGATSWPACPGSGPGSPKLEDLRFFRTYTLERVRVTAAVQDLLLYNRYRSGSDQRARLSVAWDRRDNRLFPTSGFFLSACARPGPALPGADGHLRRPGEPLLPGDDRVPLLPGHLARG